MFGWVMLRSVLFTCFIVESIGSICTFTLASSYNPVDERFYKDGKRGMKYWETSLSKRFNGARPSSRPCQPTEPSRCQSDQDPPNSTSRYQRQPKE